MPKYLWEVDYSAEGTRGVLKDGGTKRKQVAAAVVKKLGGKLESFYFTFGTRDAVVIVDLPDNVTAAAASMAVGATGAMTFRTTVLLTPEEIDQAATKKPDYRPPGS